MRTRHNRCKNLLHFVPKKSALVCRHIFSFYFAQNYVLYHIHMVRTLRRFTFGSKWYWKTVSTFCEMEACCTADYYTDRVKRILYLSPMRAAKVQASLRIRAVSPEPPLLAHTSSKSKGTFRQKARSLAPLNGWACAVTICHDGMLEDTNSLDGAHTTCVTVCLLFSFYTQKLQKLQLVQ